VKRPIVGEKMAVTMTPALADRFPRASVVHDWLTIPGGSEKVVLELLKLLPGADVYTSVYAPENWGSAFAGHRVTASFLNRIPGAATQYPKLLPLMNRAFESFDLSGYDLVVSSSHSCAKNVLTTPDTLHVCYCHTPMRHAWEPHYLEGEPLGTVSRLAARALMPRVRRDDFLGAARPDVYVANSSFVARRIAKYYRRDAAVIHPPVEVDEHLARDHDPEDYYLVLGRVVPYKRVDLAVAACAKLGRRVKVAGTGRAIDAARAAAGPDAEFLGFVPDAELGAVMAGARAILFPGAEDFGIVPVEAQAAGIPVIAYGAAGILDSVVDGVTGVFHSEQTADAVAAAILDFEDRAFDEQAIRDNARRFGPERFRREVAALVEASAQARSDRIEVR
jgi:glycosyltransferase involved in cell wall biosynthesis